MVTSRTIYKQSVQEWIGHDQMYTEQEPYQVRGTYTQGLTYS